MYLVRAAGALASLCIWPAVAWCQVVLSLLRAALGMYFAAPVDVDNGLKSQGVKQKLHISWPGLGILFWWQLGALQYLQQHFDLSAVPMIGSSAGSFIAAFAACGTPPAAIFDAAVALCRRHHAFTRPLGLLGVWGRIIHAWLHALLPPNAHHLASRSTSVVVTAFPSLQRLVLSGFTSRQDLIDACAASAHIPFFLDLRPWACFRGLRCLDGGFRYVTLRAHADLHPAGAEAVLVMDARRDAELMQAFGLRQCVSCLSPEGGRWLMQQGYEYMQRLHASGGLDRFDLESIRLPAADGAAVAPGAAAGDVGKDASGGDGGGKRVTGRRPVTFSLVASSQQAQLVQ